MRELRCVRVLRTRTAYCVLRTRTGNRAGEGGGGEGEKQEARVLGSYIGRQEIEQKESNKEIE